MERVYGPIRNPDENPEVSKMDGTGQQIDTDKLIQSYENRIQDLQKQLDLANERETGLISERSKLLDLLSAEKEEKRALMPPLEEKNRESKGWLLRLIGVR